MGGEKMMGAAGGHAHFHLLEDAELAAALQPPDFGTSSGMMRSLWVTAGLPAEA